jgi:hypothetical protein
MYAFIKSSLNRSLVTFKLSLIQKSPRFLVKLFVGKRVLGFAWNLSLRGKEIFEMRDTIQIPFSDPTPSAFAVFVRKESGQPNENASHPQS